MAKCKSCNTNIPEGTEYCKDCQDKVGVKTNESYLDSLLNSVQNSPSAENIYKKKNNTNDINSNPDKGITQVQKDNVQVAKTGKRKKLERTAELEADDLYRVDYSDIEDFSRFNFEDDLGDIENEIVINDEDLFGESISSLLGEDDGSKEEIDVHTEVNKVVEDAYANEQQAERYIEDEIAVSDNAVAELLQTSNVATLDEIDTMVEKQPVESEQEAIEAVTMENEDISMTSIPSDIDQPQDEYSELSEDADLDLDLDELLNSLDTESLEAAVERNMANPDEDMFSLYGIDELEEQLSYSTTNDREDGELEAIGVDHDDFLSLLGQVSDEDAAAEDIRAISDMLSGNSAPSRESSMPSNVGEVFSDALKAVSSLNDYEQKEDAILGNIPEQEPKKGKKAKKEKVKKEKIAKDVKSDEISKLSLFKRLFGNIKDDKTAAEFDKEQRKLAEPKAEKIKKVKGKKKVADSGEEEEASAEQKGAKNKAAKKAEKKEKAEKKKRTKEVIEVIDEIDEDPGRINRVGAGIVFCFFGMIAIILILGTNMITYTLSIQHATNYFSHRKYNQAYNEVYGVDIRDEDIGLYDKIQTVMFVNKQLNSYNNYYALEQYPEALDSLLKGLSRYDKYIELATMLGIESDLDYVRSQILAELSNVFKLTEEEATRILSYDNMEDYSLEVYNVVLEKMNN